MVLPETIQHERAKFVGGYVFSESRFNTLEGIKSYRTLILGLPVNLRQKGLLSVVHFFLSKNSQEHLDVLKDLFMWLKRCETTREILGINFPNNGRYSKFVNALLSKTSFEIAQLEEEILQLSTWLKRAVECRYLELKNDTDVAQSVTNQGNERDG